MKISKRVVELFRSSLPLRVISTTCLATAAVVLLTSLFLVDQVASGVLKGKKEASVAEASTKLEQMQRQLSSADFRTAPYHDLINQIADEAVSSATNYYVVVEGPVSTFVSPEISSASVPDEIIRAVDAEPGMYVTETEVLYRNTALEPVPGLVVSGVLQVPGQNLSVPIFFVFPENHEAQIIGIVRRATFSTSLLMVTLLVAVAVVISHQTTRPIRKASRVAEQLAKGDLDQRLEVVGNDDIARLGNSMNYMADELQTQIVQLEELSEVQRRFVSDVSHELRTPLTTVRMAAELLHESREELAPNYRRTIELMHDELDRFENLLDELLEISRFDAGAADLELEMCDLVAEAKDEIESSQVLAKRVGSTIEFTALSAAIFYGDAKRVRRIIRNLLSNAIEHGKANPIEVTVGANATAVALTVVDHGVGFDNSDSKRVFERFWRADPSRKRTLGGTGLGLSIALEDAKLHSGSLEAWGEVDQGACFRVTLPKKPGQPFEESPLPSRYNGGAR